MLLASSRPRPRKSHNRGDLSDATTNPPACGRVVEVTADPKCTRKWSESISSLVASNAAAATAWHSRIVVELANCAEQSYAEDRARAEALPLAQANTRAGSCIYSAPKHRSNRNDGAAARCSAAPACALHRVQGTELRAAAPAPAQGRDRDGRSHASNNRKGETRRGLRRRY